MPVTRVLALCLLVSFAAACASSPEPRRVVQSGGSYESPRQQERAEARAIDAPSDHFLAIARNSDHQKVGRPYTISGQRFTPRRDDRYDEVGIGSWYGPNFHGRPTANGETFDQNLMSAAHTTLPIPSIVEVTNLENGRTVRVRLNDRGPFVDDRIIDLSRAAAEALDYRAAGLARVRVRYIGPAAANDAPPARRQPDFTPPPVAAPAPNPVIHAAVAAPPPPPAPAVTPAAPVDIGRHVLQLGAFSERGNAERFALRLALDDPTWVEPGTSNGRPIYRVFAGGWSDRGAAEQALVALRDRGVYDARVVALD
jgi:rare lipoprotein A